MLFAQKGEIRLDSFYEFERDRVFFGLHNGAVNHAQGVNGKIAGNLEAFAQIKDAAILLHGPKGCAYHYRYYARRRWLPAYAIESDDLTETDLIGGGEEKLFDAALRIIGEQHPGLLVLIPTVSSDVMQSDLLGVAGAVTERTGVPVVAVRSEVFSHIDKTVMRRERKDTLKCWGKAEAPKNSDSRGCGFSEAMLTLAEQLMQPQETVRGAVNVEGYAWSYGGRMLLEGMDAMLREMGLRLLNILPHGTTQEIVRAPAAQLNIARRMRWAQALGERFGTPYLHVHAFTRYLGVEGVLQFYRDIAQKLGLSVDVDALFSREAARARERFAACTAAYAGKRILMLPRSFRMLPNRITQAVLGAGIPVTDVVAMYTEEELRQADLDAEMAEDVLRNTRRAMELCGVGGELIVNPDPETLRELAQSADLMIANEETQAFGPNIPILSDDLLFVAPLDFEQLCRNAEYLAGGLDRLPRGGRLLINRVSYAKGLYPQLDTPEAQTARELWQRLWQNRGREV